MNREKTGAFIYKLRKEKGLTQNDFAKLLNISDNSVSKWERGINTPDITSLTILSQIFNVTVTELLNGEYHFKKKNKDYQNLPQIITIHNLVKKYGSKVILNNINLNIYEGEAVGLVGINGAGKTTLIKCLLNYCHYSGDIKIYNQDLSKHYEELMPFISVSLNDYSFYKELSLKKNLQIYSLLNNINDQEYITKILNLFDLNKDLNKKVSKFSLGMMQKLNIALALLKKPKLLILDEPINALDPISIKKLRNILKELNDTENTTIIISSHILSELENLCDRIIILDHGSIIEDINITKLKYHHKSLEKEFLDLIGGQNENI